MNKKNYNHASKSMEKTITNCDLCVIGYSSKLYRDDDKAVEIEEGQHLITWVGNEDVKIDRYDVRCYFNNLSHCETGRMGYALSEEDKEMEKMCDKERYRALLHDEQERELYEEEEQKRSNQSFSKAGVYSQVPYHYDGSCSVSETDKDKKLKKTNSIVNVPSDIVEPDSDNIKEIIEKTAECVVKNGRQMEILIKTRQAQNKLFDFLTVGTSLNPYYQYVLEAIKSGRNNVQTHKPDDNIGSDHNSSLSFNVESAPDVFDSNSSVLNINCPYSTLVNKIHLINNNKGQSDFKIEDSEVKNKPRSGSTTS
uniref:SURP motif domain-containing protein n=1 Tax=Cuerna arida TaxID=1464854 RepID=A0A1B6H4P8_9HEMI